MEVLFSLSRGLISAQIDVILLQHDHYIAKLRLCSASKFKLGPSVVFLIIYLERMDAMEGRLVRRGALFIVKGGLISAKSDSF